MNIDQWQSNIEKHLFAETNNFKQARIFTGKASWNLSLANTTVEGMNEVPEALKSRITELVTAINEVNDELWRLGESK